MTELDSAQPVGPVLRLGNEFAEVEVQVVQTRNGYRLQISGSRIDAAVQLCPLELEMLARQRSEVIAALLASTSSSTVPDEDEDEDEDERGDERG